MFEHSECKSYSKYNCYCPKDPRRCRVDHFDVCKGVLRPALKRGLKLVIYYH